MLIGRLSRRAALGAIAAFALPLVAPAQAQEFPNRAIKIVVAFAAGGLTDVLARLVAADMSNTLGQQVLVENVGGAGGNIGGLAVARAKPDGYTLLFSNVGQIAVNPHTYKTMEFDPLTAYEHIGGAGEIVLLQAVHPSVRANTVAELVALAKSQPGKLNYFTSAPGGFLHVVTEVFKQRTGTDFTGVHYKGSGQALPEFLAGQTHMGMEALPLLVSHARDGRIRPLMVTAKERSPVLPDVPTAAEAGYPDLLFSAWFGLHAPKGTPQPVVQRLATALHAAVKSEAVRTKMTDSGVQPITDTPAAFAERIRADHTQLGEVARSAGIKIE